MKKLWQGKLQVLPVLGLGEAGDLTANSYVHFLFS